MHFSTADCICISGFWALCPQTLTEALPMDPTRGLPSRDSLCPNLRPNSGYTTDHYRLVNVYFFTLHSLTCIRPEPTETNVQNVYISVLWVAGYWYGYQSAILHMAQLMPLPLIVPFSTKSRLILPFTYQLNRVLTEKGHQMGFCCCSALSNPKRHFTVSYSPRVSPVPKCHILCRA